MSEAFWTDYSRHVANLMPPLVAGDGVPEAEIAAAEARLGLKLPALLREFYLVAGRREDINAVHNRLLSPESLEVDQDALVFYEENQGVVLWGIKVDDLSQADPQVFMAEYASTLEWEPEHDHLSEFLISMLFWQAVNGGMPYHGIGVASSEAIAEATGWETVNWSGEKHKNPVRLRDGQVLFIVGNDPGPEVYGGGRTREDFLAVEKAFDISWDYSTLDEEDESEEDEENKDAENDE